MDLETENSLAALLMEEARRLRKQADEEGVHVYLRQPKVRGRPNARFLTATVLGVQQANRAVEVNEMWHAREKELELDNRLTNRSKDKDRHRGERHHDDSSKMSYNSRDENNSKSTASSSSSKHEYEDCYTTEDGFMDEDIEKFLRSRIKRGRGAVGSRMDETGPYPTGGPSHQEGNVLANADVRMQEEWQQRVLGPEKPHSLNSQELLKDGVSKTKKVKKEDASSLKKQHSEKHRSEEKSRKKKRKEQKSKHKHRRRSH